MKKILVPILTEEYKILVILGEVEELAKYISNNVDGWDYNRALKQVKKTRGSAFDRLSHGYCPKHPLITLDINLPYEYLFSTLPHEASHCAGYIMEYIGIEDPTDELRGHIISAVVRNTLKKLFGKRKLTLK